MTTKLLPTTFVAIFLATSWMGAPAAADEPAPAEKHAAGEEHATSAADPVLADIGRPLYQRHCASCHGATGRGDGPVGPALRVPPADLTTIALRRGGRFPSSRIARFIDGRFQLPIHGTRAMPVWGERFGADIPESDIGESISRGKIVVLVEFLKSIQDPPLLPKSP